MKIKEEEKEILASFSSSDTSKLILRILDDMCMQQAQAIISLPLPATSDRDLLIAKAKAEGAVKLKSDLNILLGRYRESQ